VGGQDATIDLEHVFLEDKMFAPDINDALLESASRRTIIVKARDTAIDLYG
jgi:hypothetical protein